ncbi:hypothetical protein Zmor_023324 [Zophobas morio]|uniref:Peptidase aspartic putative domain-containing protein n=1 Tax=Zophobas morio TaxID=2755281 RepID=A0AA38M798_9CUCU|nr:hypothetical protein Zmor_023324 [Zophobas morio]
MTTEQLSGLNMRRGALKRKLTMAQNFIDDLKSSKESTTCLSIIQEYLTRTRSMYDEFFNIQSQIEELEIILKQTSTADQCITFDKECYTVVCELEALEAKYSAKSAKKYDIPIVQNSAVNVKLPELTFRVATKSTNKNKKTNLNTNSKRSVTCPYCSDPHNLFCCAKFINLMVTDRLRIVRSKKLCSNCFQNSHKVTECKSSYVCKICKGHHNTLLHVDNPEPNEIPSTSSDNNQVKLDQSVVLKANSQQVYFSKVLPTAQVQIYGKFGNKPQVRPLLESGSELNFISERKLLNLKSQPNVLSIAGVNRCNTSVSQLASIKINSNYRHYELNLSCVILPQISEFLPSTSFSIANLEFPHHNKSPDPAFHVKGTIDLLLGAQPFFEILQPNRRCLNKDFILQETKFGWVVVNAHGDNPGVVKQGSSYYVQPVLEQMVGKFWQLDKFKTSAKPQSADEILCEKKFMKDHKRLEMGRYSVYHFRSKRKTQT